VVDIEARQAARSSRLEMYEADNYGEDGTAPAVDDDEEFFVDDHDVCTQILISRSLQSRVTHSTADDNEIAYRNRRYIAWKTQGSHRSACSCPQET
jgi:hypothetical protein